MNNVLMQERAVKAGFFDREAVRQKKQAILLLETGVAGIKHHLDLKSEQDQQLLRSLTPGTRLRMYRDVDNEHDKWAVTIRTQEDRTIGYITRHKGETVARLLDYGKELFVEVIEPVEKPADHIQFRRNFAYTEGFEVRIAIYMEEW